MHLVTCQNPKQVFNPYNKEEMSVPCGYCDICLSHRSANWVSRLELERMCHPYALFFTLTYSDEYVPKCELRYIGSLPELVNCQTGEVLSFKSLNLNSPHMAKSKNYVLKRGWLCCPHVPYIQNFIKRLRSKVKYYEQLPNNQRIRYFIATEYGPTTHRVHHHGILFFESEYLANHAKEVIASAWSSDNRNQSSKSLGRIDVQFIEGNASCYVAQYLNCSANLPEIYKNKAFRPTALFSKCPSIGSLLCNSEEIQEIFNSGLTKYNQYDRSLGKYLLRPLPVSLENRLYPKIRSFDSIDSRLRTRLYQFLSEQKPSITCYGDFKDLMFKIFPEYESREKDYPQFVKDSDYMVRPCVDSAFREYLAKVFFDYSVEPRLLEMRRRRFFSTLMRFEYQCLIFGLSPQEYLERIVDYYDNKYKDKLNEQFLMEDYIARNESVQNNIFVDTLFLKRIKERGYVTQEELIILSSYGWNEDNMSYQDFIDSLDFHNSKDFIGLVSRSHKICEKNRKTKIKNEYVSAHMSNSLISAIYG